MISLRTQYASEYATWAAIKSRCYNQSQQFYHDYGARGIFVCDRWRYSFSNFIEDMGSRPSPNHSLDRIDNDGNHCPDNCRWATRSEQQSNRRCCRYAYSKTGFKGVYARPNRTAYRAEIESKGISYYLGTYQNPEDAACAYDAKARELFGKFAVFNFPPVAT